MRKYLFIFLLYGLANGQVSNPCDDERFNKISEKFVDQMTDIEYQYFIKKQEECTEYENNANIPNPKDNSNLEIRTSDQVPNPCEDERFIKISEKYVDLMTEIEYQYFLKKQKECAEYDKDNPILKSLKNNPVKVEKINLLGKLSFIFQHSSLLVIAFLIAITSYI